jgi:hypothetical protein
MNLMNLTFGIGLIMVGVAVFMFLIALPRRGEQARFLRGRYSLETGYAMLFTLLLAWGGVLAAANWN